MDHKASVFNTFICKDCCQPFPGCLCFKTDKSNDKKERRIAKNDGIKYKSVKEFSMELNNIKFFITSSNGEVSTKITQKINNHLSAIHLSGDETQGLFDFLRDVLGSDLS